MKTKKIVITRKNGHYTVKGSGDRYLQIDKTITFACCPRLTAADEPVIGLFED